MTQHNTWAIRATQDAAGYQERFRYCVSLFVVTAFMRSGRTADRMNAVTTNKLTHYQVSGALESASVSG